MKQSLAIAYAMKKRAKKMAAGGFINDEMASGYDDHKVNMMAEGGMPEDKKISVDPDKAAEFKKGFDKAFGMAEGGQITGASMDDIVDKIMKKRAAHYSEGGKIANGGEDDIDHMADGKPNNFDDLALRDDLESSYTGANSGDELGNDQEDKERDDIVSKIMASRRKKDRMPNPA